MRLPSLAATSAGLLCLVAVLGSAGCSRTTARATKPTVSSPVPSPSPSPQITVAGCSRGQLVTDAASLGIALAGATPGTAIVMAPGTYAGQFVADVPGTSDAPISLCGSKDSIIDGGDIKAGYSLYLNGASWWNLKGFTIQGGQKGVVTDHASHVTISGLNIHDIGDEGIHLRSFSTDNIVEGNTIRRTGLLRPKFGEGIYIGSAKSNWCKYSACKPDASDRNTIRNNDVSETTAENVDIKEGTTAGVLIDNRFSGVGMNPKSATAWVNVKGNGWTISGNVGQISVKDGFQVHEVYAGWGLNNVFRANQAMVNGPGYGYYTQHKSLGTVVGCDNTAVGAAKGLSNTPCAS